MEKTLISGYLGSDPERSSDAAPVRMSVACSRKWKKDGEQQERTQWYSVVVWGPQGDPCLQYLSTGDYVLVEGRMESSEYETSEGEKRTSWELVAARVEFGPRASEGHKSPGKSRDRASAAGEIDPPKPKPAPKGDGEDDGIPF